MTRLSALLLSLLPAASLAPELRAEIAAHGRPAVDRYYRALAAAESLRALAAKDRRSPRRQARIDERYRTAVRLLEEAIELAPEWGDPLFALAALHLETAHYPEAEAACLAFLKLDPDNARGKTQLVEIRRALAASPEPPPG